LEADLGGLALEEGVRNLHQDARAVAGARIGADRAAMFEVAQDVERVGDDLMRPLALDVGDEADAAGILFQRKVVEADRLGPPTMFALDVLAFGLGRFRTGSHRRRIAQDVFALDFLPAHFIPLNPAKSNASPCSAHLGRPAAPTGPPLVLKASRIFLNSGRAFSVTANRFTCTFAVQKHRNFVAIPVPGSHRSCDSDTVLTRTMPNFCLSHKRRKVARLLDGAESTLGRNNSH
jgi:hypothetical protein